MWSRFLGVLSTLISDLINAEEILMVVYHLENHAVWHGMFLLL